MMMRGGALSGSWSSGRGGAIVQKAKKMRGAGKVTSSSTQLQSMSITFAWEPSMAHEC